MIGAHTSLNTHQRQSRIYRAAIAWFTLFILTAGSLPTAPAQAGECRIAAAGSAVNVRRGPSDSDYAAIGQLAPGEARSVVGRSAGGYWYAIDYNGARGWVAATVVSAWGACVDLPVLASPPPSPHIAALEAVPVLPHVSDAVREIYARGQSRGADAPNPHAIAKIGDCNSESAFYLFPLDYRMYDLGPYADLQPTVEFFNGFFSAESVAARAGFTTYSVLDPLLANPAHCNPGETPLACEYRLRRPAAALIGLGSNDARFLTLDEYRANLRAIIDVTLDADIVPVLVTFTERTNERWEQALAVNMVMVEVAAEYNIPLVNFWRAARSLPGFGLIAGSTRLSHGWREGDPVRVDLDAGQEANWGHALHNLLTLQTLDMLRRELIKTPH